MTSPTSDVEMPVLAERARTIIAGGRRALLTLPCANVRGWAGLIDDGGEPLLIVGADSPPVHCAGSGRRARVDICGHNGERLVLAGALRLVPETTDQIIERLATLGRSITVTEGDLGALRILSVSVDDVLICLPERAARAAGGRSAAASRGGRARPAGTTATNFRLARVGRSSRGLRRANSNRLDGRSNALGPARRVELDSYAFAEPDLIAAYAPDLIRHLNDEHSLQMRILAAHGVALAEPAGSDPAGLDPTDSTDPTDPDFADPTDPAGVVGSTGLADSGGGESRSGHAGFGTISGPGHRRAEVIAASVTSLDRRGLDMWRIDQDGAREIRVTFRSPLDEPRSLGRELRLLLDQAEHPAE